MGTPLPAADATSPAAAEVAPEPKIATSAITHIDSDARNFIPESSWFSGNNYDAREVWRIEPVKSLCKTTIKAKHQACNCRRKL
jgi:hypothetical protein